MTRLARRFAAPNRGKDQRAFRPLLIMSLPAATPLADVPPPNADRAPTAPPALPAMPPSQTNEAAKPSQKTAGKSFAKAKKPVKRRKVKSTGTKGRATENGDENSDDSEDDEDAEDAEDDDDDGASDEEPPSDFEDDEGEADFQAVGHSKSAAERLAAKGKKAGNRGRFHGEQLSLLLEHEQAYRNVPKGKRGKNKRLKEFMTNFRALFWKQFTWTDVRMGMNEKYANAKRTEVIQRTNKVSTIH